MKRARFIILFVFSLIFIDYNLSYVFAQGVEWQRIRTTLAPEQASISAGVPLIEYFISAGDTVEIFVWQNPDLTRTVTVGPDGKISYPLVGRLDVVGLTIEQLEEAIRERIAKYIKYPQVSVMMKEFSGDKIIILGEINYPGVYTYIGKTDLIEVIARAGDFTDRAREDSIIIVRGNLTENPKAIRVNLSRALRKGTIGTDIVLMANDVIYIPKSFIGNISKFLDNMTPTLDRVSQILSLRKEIRLWPEK